MEQLVQPSFHSCLCTIWSLFFRRMFLLKNIVVYKYRFIICYLTSPSIFTKFRSEWKHIQWIGNCEHHVRGYGSQRGKIVLDEQIESWRAKDPIIEENAYKEIKGKCDVNLGNPGDSAREDNPIIEWDDSHQPTIDVWYD